MAAIVASRFAVLSVDDDDDSSPKKKKNPTKKTPTVKSQNSTSVKSEGSGKKKKKQENAPQAHSKNASKGNASSNAKKKKQVTAEQWEKWKQKDTEYVEGNFEEDLNKAILLSKLDYEQKKNSKKTDEEKQTTKKSKKGQKIFPVEEPKNLGSQSRKLESVEAKTEEQGLITEEHLLRLNINRQDLLSLISHKALIEKKDAEIERLKNEIEAMNTQLRNVKTRNTKLCQIIASAELKDKAEVLMEVERLQTIKDELSSEIAAFHIQLEQERSKNRQLIAELKAKDKSKRHHISGELQ